MPRNSLCSLAFACGMLAALSTMPAADDSAGSATSLSDVALRDELLRRKKMDQEIRERLIETVKKSGDSFGPNALSDPAIAPIAAR